MSELTQAQLKEVLRYEPDTGHFYWIKRISSRCKMDKPAGCIGGNYSDNYLIKQIKIFKKLYKQHRLAFLYMTGSFPRHEVDHVNGNSLDNCWINLRDIPHSINMQNFGKPNRNNKLGQLGVSLYRDSGKYSANISDKGKAIAIGVYDTIDQASDAYFNAKFLLHEGMINERFNA
jgi:hypothetical protein